MGWGVGTREGGCALSYVGCKGVGPPRASRHAPYLFGTFDYCDCFCFAPSLTCLHTSRPAASMRCIHQRCCCECRSMTARGKSGCDSRPLRAGQHIYSLHIHFIQRTELPSLVYRRASLRALRQAMHRLGILYPLRTIQARSPSNTTYGAPQNLGSRIWCLKGMAVVPHPSKQLHLKGGGM